MALAASLSFAGLGPNEQEYAVSGSLTIHGAAPNQAATYCSRADHFRNQLAMVVFTESSTGYTDIVSIACSSPGFSFSTTLPPGTYNVRVMPGRDAAEAKVNLVPGIYLTNQGVVIAAPVAGLVLNASNANLLPSNSRPGAERNIP